MSHKVHVLLFNKHLRFKYVTVYHTVLLFHKNLKKQKRKKRQMNILKIICCFPTMSLTRLACWLLKRDLQSSTLQAKIKLHPPLDSGRLPFVVFLWTCILRNVRERLENCLNTCTILGKCMKCIGMIPGKFMMKCLES